MKKLSLYKNLLIVLTILLFVSPGKTFAQSIVISISPSVQCFVPGFTIGASAVVSVPNPSATSYTWYVAGPCAPTNTTTSSTGTQITVFYPCCGTYTYYCTAYNGTNSLSSTSHVAFVVCSPTVSVFAPPSICAGSSTTLLASGALSYTWSNGFTGPAVVVSPTTTASYTVTGMSSSGCIDTAATTINVIHPPNPSFTYFQGGSGQVAFNNTSVSSGSITNYLWNFGNGQISNSYSASTTYSANGIYTVSLTANNGCGPVVSTQTILISSIGGACIANFISTPLSSGNYTFMSTSILSGTNTTYYWNFGNGSPTYVSTGSSGMFPPLQTYPTTGVYTVSLRILSTNPNCLDSVSHVINVCAVHPSFNYTRIGSTTYSFANLSTGTTAISTYSWSYGDGATSLGNGGVHTYSASGVYTVLLKVSNTSSCSATLAKTITVTTCSLASNFTHTVLTNGAVNFSNTSVVSPVITDYKWDFGDGVYSLQSNPTHTYVNAGTYYVTLKLQDTTNFCSDSLTQSINVTGISCVADANFTITPTSTPQYWNAIPDYPWNVSAASWSWGDGSSSNGLYSSHVYANAGTYSICLSVTVSCGSSGTYCFPYYVNKTADTTSQVVYINVVAPDKTNGLIKLSAEAISFQVYPNPNSGTFTLGLENIPDETIKISVYSMLGEQVYLSEEFPAKATPIKEVHLENANNGIYFVKINTSKGMYLQKIIINK